MTVCATRRSGNFGGQKGYAARTAKARSINGTGTTTVVSTVTAINAKVVKNILTT